MQKSDLTYLINILVYQKDWTLSYTSEFYLSIQTQLIHRQLHYHKKQIHVYTVRVILID